MASRFLACIGIGVLVLLMAADAFVGVQEMGNPPNIFTNPIVFIAILFGLGSGVRALWRKIDA